LLCLKKLFERKDHKYKFTIQEPTTETCPNCGSKLENIPDWKNGKMTCPYCGEVIVVRSGKLFTSDEANVRDLLDKINRTLFDIEITRQYFNSTRQKLSNEFGIKASINDTIWRILNLINTPKKSFQQRKFIYLAMSHILRMENKSTNEVMAKFHQMDLLEIKEFMKDSGLDVVVKIQTCNDEFVCDECRKLSKIIFTIDEALKTMPIPNMCTNESCRCSWAIQFSEYD